ncbi:uncharacterized protein LOC132685464 [Panthera onca]
MSSGNCSSPAAAGPAALPTRLCGRASPRSPMGRSFQPRGRTLGSWEFTLSIPGRDTWRSNDGDMKIRELPPQVGKQKVKHFQQEMLVWFSERISVPLLLLHSICPHLTPNKALGLWSTPVFINLHICHLCKEKHLISKLV